MCSLCYGVTTDHLQSPGCWKNLSMSLRNLDCLQKHPMPKVSFCAGVRGKDKRKQVWPKSTENLGVFLVSSTALDLVLMWACSHDKSQSQRAETDYHLLFRSLRMGYMDMLILQKPIVNIFIVLNIHSALKLLLKENRHFIWLIISLHALEKDPGF